MKFAVSGRPELGDRSFVLGELRFLAPPDDKAPVMSLFRDLLCRTGKGAWGSSCSTLSALLKDLTVFSPLTSTSRAVHFTVRLDLVLGFSNCCIFDSFSVGCEASLLVKSLEVSSTKGSFSSSNDFVSLTFTNKELSFSPSSFFLSTFLHISVNVFCRGGVGVDFDGVRPWLERGDSADVIVLVLIKVATGELNWDISFIAIVTTTNNKVK